MVASIFQPSAIACSLRHLIQPKMPAAISQPISMSSSLPTGVAGGKARLCLR
jgi:hypothetical protein